MSKLINVNELSPLAKDILKSLKTLPDKAFLSINKNQYPDTTLREFYEALSELKNTNMIRFFRQDYAYKEPQNLEDEIKKNKYPILLSILPEYRNFEHLKL